MKPEKDPSRLCCCYSFINDPGWLTDYEVLTDELCAQLGMAFSSAETDAALPDLLPVLERLQALALHANGSVRGKLAVTEADLDWLQLSYNHFRQEIEAKEPDRMKRFVLPRGLPPVPELHQARSTAKKALRCLARVEEEGRRKIPPEIPRFLNMLCNFCFLLTVLVNQRRGVAEPVFVSQSYRI
ncbi:MAG: ATP:cob(I)alamin adenosyltransferase [Zoogloeaceae bacterium]|jgi:cob(I)alamin adenosyltransferase|nr:ATP:cob(I)alamin adenosyltransferase [Zoogloeaceae bacterium]